MGSDWQAIPYILALVPVAMLAQCFGMNAFGHFRSWHEVWRKDLGRLRLFMAAVLALFAVPLFQFALYRTHPHVPEIREFEATAAARLLISVAAFGALHAIARSYPMRRKLWLVPLPLALVLFILFAPF